MSAESINPAPSKKGVSPIVNVRIPVDDIEEIRKAAKLSSLPLATFIRVSALSEARQVIADKKNKNPAPMEKSS